MWLRTYAVTPDFIWESYIIGVSLHSGQMNHFQVLRNTGAWGMKNQVMAEAVNRPIFIAHMYGS